MNMHHKSLFKRFVKRLSRAQPCDNRALPCRTRRLRSRPQGSRRRNLRSSPRSVSSGMQSSLRCSQRSSLRSSFRSVLRSSLQPQWGSSFWDGRGARNQQRSARANVSVCDFSAATEAQVSQSRCCVYDAACLCDCLASVLTLARVCASQASASPRAQLRLDVSVRPQEP